MRKTIHVGMVIEHILSGTDAQIAKLFNSGRKGGHHGATYRKELQRMVDEGQRVIPIGDKCDNWDPVKGCMGHEYESVKEEEADESVVMSNERLNSLIEDDVNDILIKLRLLYEKVATKSMISYKWDVNDDFDITSAGRGLETIMQMAAKIKDRTEGKPIVDDKTKKYRGTCVYKIRKALGYTYP